MRKGHVPPYADWLRDSRGSNKRCSIEAAAEGILAVANSNMERALRHISVERGHDLRQFSLMPFGGAGGLHAVELARSLSIPQIIVPGSGGTLSAPGFCCGCRQGSKSDSDASS